MRRLIGIGFVLAAGWWTGAAGAATCQVPSTGHPTIQSAIDDSGCTQLDLAATTFVESVTIARDLVVAGHGAASTVVRGQVEVTAGDVNLADLTVQAATGTGGGSHPDALWAHAGAHVSGTGLVVVRSPALFVDGFESGDTSAWSGVAP